MTFYIGKRPVAGQSVQYKEWVSDGGNSFSLGFVPSSTESCLIFYDGIPMIPKKEYVIDGAGTVIFTKKIPVGTMIYATSSLVANYNNKVEGLAKSPKTERIVIQASGTTSVTLQNIPDEGTTEVYINGVMKTPTTDYYVISNIVQFYSELSMNDVITVKWFE
jgi:hypothetical protein